MRRFRGLQKRVNVEGVRQAEADDLSNIIDPEGNQPMQKRRVRSERVAVESFRRSAKETRSGTRSPGFRLPTRQPRRICR